MTGENLDSESCRSDGQHKNAGTTYPIGGVGGQLMGSVRQQWKVLPKTAGMCWPESGLATAAKGSRSWILGRFPASELLDATGGSGPTGRDTASGGLGGRHEGARGTGMDGRQT